MCIRDSVSGQTATVTFNNVLKRGSLEVTKNSEDGVAEGMAFHVSGTSLAGRPVDEYAVTDSTGVARFENVLIGTGFFAPYTVSPRMGWPMCAMWTRIWWDRDNYGIEPDGNPIGQLLYFDQHSAGWHSS